MSTAQKIGIWLMLLAGLIFGWQLTVAFAAAVSHEQACKVAESRGWECAP